MAGWPGDHNAIRRGRAVLRRQRELPGVLTDLQTCQTAFANPNPNDNQGDNNIKGFRWAQDNGGMTLFNTIVPPTSTQYTFGYATRLRE